MDIYQNWGNSPGDVDCLEDSEIREMVNVLGLVAIPYIVGTILGMVIVLEIS